MLHAELNHFHTSVQPISFQRIPQLQWCFSSNGLEKVGKHKPQVSYPTFRFNLDLLVRRLDKNISQLVRFLLVMNPMMVDSRRKITGINRHTRFGSTTFRSFDIQTWIVTFPNGIGKDRPPTSNHLELRGCTGSPIKERYPACKLHQRSPVRLRAVVKAEASPNKGSYIQNQL